MDTIFAPETEERCPCCGGQRLPGLFEEVPCPPLPQAVHIMLTAGLVGAFFSENRIAVDGRTFVRAFGALPFDRPDGPLVVGTWVELAGLDAEKLTRASWRRTIKLRGQLAADLPGFPGSLGTYAEVEVSGEGFRLSYCDDLRVQALAGPLDHEQMTALYRRCWGGGEPLPANPVLRQAAYGAWRRHLGREPVVRDITPPPPLVGLAPAQLLVFPPQDTGGVAELATVGAGETAPYPAEMLCRATDPPPEFVQSFAEFLYAPRLTYLDLVPGHVIGETEPIGGTQNMFGWMILEELESVPLAGGEQLRLLSVVPLHMAELAYAMQHSSEALHERLTSGLDRERLLALDREPLITP